MNKEAKEDIIRIIWGNLLALNPIPDEFCCLSCLVWEVKGWENPVSTAEWAMRYEQEENQ
jgi:hypothetical protein